MNIHDKYPLKQKAKFPHRKTVCISRETRNLLETLESDTDIDVPEMIRMAIDEYIVRRKLDRFVGEKLSVQ